MYDSFSAESEVAWFLVEMITALNILWDHDNRYVHRDIKPENILVKPDGSLVVIDLGIIRETGAQGVTMTMMPYGPCTPLYASPEQLKNDKKNINYKSDLFGLGVLAYTLLAKGNPFATSGSDALEDIVAKVLEYNPESLFEMGVCSKVMSDVVEKLMQKSPYRRYRKVGSVIEELNQLLK